MVTRRRFCRDQPGPPGRLDKGSVRVMRAAPAVQGIATDTSGRTPTASARPFGPLLVETFQRLEAAGDVTRCGGKSEYNRFGKPNVIHHFLRFCFDVFCEQAIGRRYSRTSAVQLVTVPKTSRAWLRGWDRADGLLGQGSPAVGNPSEMQSLPPTRDTGSGAATVQPS